MYHSLGTLTTGYFQYIYNMLIGELEGKSVTNQVQGCKRVDPKYVLQLSLNSA